MKKLTPVKAIRLFCLDCCGMSRKDVESCTANPDDIKAAKLNGDNTDYEGCPLYRYRMGRNPARQGGRKAKQTPNSGLNPLSTTTLRQATNGSSG